MALLIPVFAFSLIWYHFRQIPTHAAKDFGSVQSLPMFANHKHNIRRSIRVSWLKVIRSYDTLGFITFAPQEETHYYIMGRLLHNYTLGCYTKLGSVSYYILACCDTPLCNNLIIMWYILYIYLYRSTRLHFGDVH